MDDVVRVEYKNSDWDKLGCGMMIQELFKEVFDEKKNVKNYGSAKCIELIIACENKWPRVDFGNHKNGWMNIENILKYVEAGKFSRENRDPYVCPKCGAVRINWGQNFENDDYIEHHGFCRQCEMEVIVMEEKNGLFKVT